MVKKMCNKESQKLFDKTFSDKGGILNLDEIEKESATIFTHFKERANIYIESCRKHPSLIKEPPTIIFDYINNPELNAIATKNNDGIYFIGINSGTIIILYDLFFRMMSNPKVLKNIGDTSLEIEKSPSLRNYYLDANLLIDYGYIDFDSYKMLMPKDKSRQLYARHLVEKAVDFLIAHELTHIINGHLDYIKIKFETKVYDERHKEIRFEEELLTIQTLEMDADSMAVSKGLSNEIKKHIGDQYISEDLFWLYRDFNDTVFNWSLAILTMVRIMVEASTYRDVDSITRKHPHPRVRQVTITTTIDEYLKNFYPKQYLEFDKTIYIELLLTIEETYTFITGNSLDKEEFIQAVKNGNEYWSRIFNYWYIIRDDLAKQSYVDLFK